MAAINNDWLDALKDEFRKPYYAKLYQFIKEEYNQYQVFQNLFDNLCHLL